MRFSTATVFSALMAFAAAYTQPDYNKPPQGNAIYTPSLQEQVPRGVPFKITWDNNLGSTVSLVLLRGPSNNVVPYETIAENIANTGSYTWTPPANLEVDTTHYGILLVVEGTGAYQWSTQFGIAAGTVTSSSSSAAAATTTAKTETTAAPSSTKATIVTVINDVTTTYCPEEASSSAAVSAATTKTAAASSYSTIWATFESTTTICPETQTTAAATTVPVTGVPVPPSSTRVPIRSTMRSSVAPSGVAPTGTAGVSPSSTPVFNGAGRNAISFGAIAAAAFAVFAL